MRKTRVKRNPYWQGREVKFSQAMQASKRGGMERYLKAAGTPKFYEDPLDEAFPAEPPAQQGREMAEYIPPEDLPRSEVRTLSKGTRRRGIRGKAKSGARRQCGPASSGGAPGKKTAKGAVNIKVNVMSRNPKKKRAVTKARKNPRRRAATTRRVTPAKRNPRRRVQSRALQRRPRKMSRNVRYVVAANKRNGDCLYWTGEGGRFSDRLLDAKKFGSVKTAKENARALFARGMSPAVKSLEVKRA